MSRPAAFLAALAALAGRLAAQGGGAADSQPPPPLPARWTHVLEHHGKWASAAAAVGFTVLAAREHRTANDTWDELLDWCHRYTAACTLHADGRYADTTAERLYQRTLEHDHRARRRLVVGQVSLLVSAALFILDLGHAHGGPPNIPFHGLEVTAGPTGSGAQVRVRLPF